MLIRKALINDLEGIIILLNDDSLGLNRESCSYEEKQKYHSAFSEILVSKNFDIFVMVKDNEIIGCYQIMFLPHISLKGSRRCQIESLRIRSDYRSRGYGTSLMNHAIEFGKKKKCSIVQLTTNKKRYEIKNFYKKLGFSSTHIGYKLYY